jgi:hypothetical protein
MSSGRPFPLPGARNQRGSARPDDASGLHPFAPAASLHHRPCARARNPLRSGARGVAQSGSASALGAEGRPFESGRPDQKTVGNPPFPSQAPKQLNKLG